MMSVKKFDITIREGKGFDPAVLIKGLKAKYGGLYTKKLKIENLTYDNEVVSEKVSGLQNSIRRGKKLPPIIVIPTNEKDVYKVVDGNHRVAAYLREGIHEIEALIPNGT